MKKLKTILSVLTVSILTTQGASASDGGQSGDGGAGTIKNGKPVTFYSGGYYQEPNLQVDKIDLDNREAALQIRIEKLAKFVADFEYWGQSYWVRTQNLQRIIPSKDRHYYNISYADLNMETYKNIMREYRKVHGIPETIMLNLFTNPTTSETWILPSFYQLSENDAVAQLFHEFDWIRKPNATYQEIVDDEKAFQAFYEQPGNYARMYVFAKRMGNQDRLSEIAYKYDMQKGNMNNLLKGRKQIPMMEFLGRDFMNTTNSYSKNNGVFVVSHMRKLAKENPKSLFLNGAAVSGYFAAENIEFSMFHTQQFKSLQSVNSVSLEDFSNKNASSSYPSERADQKFFVSDYRDCVVKFADGPGPEVLCRRRNTYNGQMMLDSTFYNFKLYVNRDPLYVLAPTFVRYGNSDLEIVDDNLK